MPKTGRISNRKLYFMGVRFRFQCLVHVHKIWPLKTVKQYQTQKDQPHA